MVQQHYPVTPMNMDDVVDSFIQRKLSKRILFKIIIGNDRRRISTDNLQKCQRNRKMRSCIFLSVIACLIKSYCLTCVALSTKSPCISKVDKAKIDSCENVLGVRLNPCGFKNYGSSQSSSR